MTHKYLDDGGLKEPVRAYGEGFNVAAMIREHFRLPERTDGREEFNRFAIPRLFLATHRKDGTAGHMRLFSSQTGHGWTFYHYGLQAPNTDWAMHRRWNFGLFCVHHVEPDKKATDPAGWTITWAKLKFAKSYRGFTITWQLADVFKCKKEPRKSGFGLKSFFS